MMSTNLKLLLLGLVVFAAVAQEDGTRRVRVTSPDGSQTGGAEVSRDGTSGRAFASSTGRQSASSSVSLTVTGGSASSGSFSTRGDREGVSGRVSSGGGGGRGGGGRRERRQERREEQQSDPIVPGPSMLGGSSGAVSSSSSSVSSSSESSAEGTVDESSRSVGGVVADEEAGTDKPAEADDTVEVVESSQSSEGVEEDGSEEVTESSEEAEEAEEAEETMESAQSGGPIESEAFQPADRAPRGDFSSAVSISGQGGTSTSLISGSSSSGERKKICVRTQSEFEQKLKEGYEVTLVRKVSGGNVEVLREHRDASSYSRSRIISSVIPKEIKKECDITEATLGIKKRTDGSFSSASSSSITSSSSSTTTSGSFSSGQSTIERQTPRKQGIFRLCSEDNLKKFSGLKNICDRLLERNEAQRRGDAFDIKSEFG